MLEQKLESYLREQLKDNNSIRPADQDAVFAEKQTSGKRFLDILPGLQPDAQAEFLKLISAFYRIPFREIGIDFPLDAELAKLVPEKAIRHFKVVPIEKENGKLTVAMFDATDVVLIDRLRQYARCEINPVFATSADLTEAIEKVIGAEDPLKRAIHKAMGPKKQAKAPTKKKGEPVMIGAEVTTQVVGIVNLIIEKAVENHASDIHIEPSEKVFYVRYRIDGVLYDYEPLPPKAMESAIISRIKIMANLDIAEKRLPQDGRIQYKNKDRDIDLRVSTFPTIHGENIVIRVLDRTDSFRSLEEIGLSETWRDKISKLLGQAHGMILVTGPTGSGKTTSLYATLSKIDCIERHIMTLEDPVEYRLERIRQSQVDVKSGLTFARGLRSIMRQDPDVIMVGEIRDVETAQIAIQAALTGHLVLSTLHTNDAASTITRLIDMGVEPFLISSSILSVIAQRLVRVLCPECKKPYQLDREVRAELGIDELERSASGRKIKFNFHQRVGCKACKGTGYLGRLGLFEVMIPDDEIRKMIVQKESAEVISEVARKKGMESMRRDGLLKAAQGVTTIDEVLRVTQQ